MQEIVRIDTKDSIPVISDNTEKRKKYREYTNRYRHKRSIYYKDLKGGKCSKCGYDKNYAALDFHHLDPKLKDFDVNSINMTTYPKDLVEKEVAKCILLCRNCHMELHWQGYNK